MEKEACTGQNGIPGLATEVSFWIRQGRGGGSFWNHLRAAVGDNYLTEAVLFVKGAQPTLGTAPSPHLLISWCFLLAKSTRSQEMGEPIDPAPKGSLQSSDRRHTCVGDVEGRQKISTCPFLPRSPLGEPQETLHEYFKKSVLLLMKAGLNGKAQLRALDPISTSPQIHLLSGEYPKISAVA